MLLWRYRDRLARPAEAFVLYIAGYAVFRFLVEFVRGNEVVWAGLTRPQLFLALVLPLVLARVWWLWRSGGLAAATPAPGPTQVRQEVSR